MTGKYLTGQSKVVGASTLPLKFSKNKLNLNKVLTRSLKKESITSNQIVEKTKQVKAIESKEKEIKTTKGGKY